ncbi:DnaA family protein [Sphaerotilus sulfidivorans]|uniref:DnaA family protein n=2 Tax=Sphaerotilus sulfidivorans TaxID=639200 RepID=A0ABV2IRD4_9BURK|nr:DnaA/Hda family protein [Sphaerotilus sulfidivorans]MCK6400391.1 DnaA/Hda family protein [Sphaerotilus sulfidivorans]
MSRDPSSTMRQVPLAFGPEPVLRFDTFVPGANAQWEQVLMALLAPNPTMPLYLWGPPGSGKSHLMQAAASQTQSFGLRVAAFDLKSPVPWEFDEEARLLILDDCDRYDRRRQHEAFRMFVEATTLGVPILAAGRLPPVDLPVRDDLRTRLAWGLVYRLVPPTDEQVRALLRREAERRGITLDDEMMAELVGRAGNELVPLMELLDRLDRYALSNKKAVTLALLRQMLAEPDEI